MSKVRVIEVRRDPKKENQFKELVVLLEGAGVRVRREKLRAGPGWKAVSGGCRAGEERLLFVDPRLPQDDQLLFLRARVQQLGLTVPSETPAQ